MGRSAEGPTPGRPEDMRVIVLIGVVSERNRAWTLDRGRVLQVVS